MPGFDGTGPRGLGPLTGEGSGYCMIKEQPAAGDQVVGFAGLSGRPVTMRTVGMQKNSIVACSGFRRCRKKREAFVDKTLSGMP
ncbi:MAG: DUF5320 domain-containing protein [Deltaproteobacteria bacterium]|nr:DUF5320 domain-containing protein [Deltaproteobacteria bacterium]